MSKKHFNLEDLRKELAKPSKKAASKNKKIKIDYDDAIVAFIDLLGFSQKIEIFSKKEAEVEIEKLEQILDKVIAPSHLSKVHVNYFSDCICISESLPKENAENYLDTIFYFLLNLLHIQGELIFQGYLVRGGISIDRHYSSGRLIFSKGLLRSYRIESKKAVNPVIMLDESVYKKLVKFHEKKSGTYLNKDHYLYKVNSLLGLSIELPSGDYILNYLSFWREVDHESYITPFFEQHKKMIIDAVKEHKDEDSILAKYKWMASYHNFYLSKVYELNQEKHDDMLIDIDKIFGSFVLPKI